MESNNNYLFFDGSNLIVQIKQLQNARGVFKGHKLDMTLLVNAFAVADGGMRDVMGQGYRRATFYFAREDKQVEQYLTLPDFTRPRLTRDIEIRYCGAKLPNSMEYDEWLRTVPDKFLDRCQKSEKGVDIEICCDALQLAATGRLDRLFLLSNDSDFLPLCRKLKELGANVSLLRLSDARPVNKKLVQACDSYDVVHEALLLPAFGLPADAETKS
jgi:uncharacterized LabA/DUF88 family protein